MAHKEPIKIYGGTDLSNKVTMFNQKSTDPEPKSSKSTTQDLGKPFAKLQGGSQLDRLSEANEGYGRPPPGSKTEARGKKAGQLVNNEVLTLCEMINEFGVPNEEDGTIWITFGELFQIYTRISNKLVGMLLRARKHNLLYFEGEMLFQRKDDNVIITLVQPIREIRMVAGVPVDRPPAEAEAAAALAAEDKE